MSEAKDESKIVTIDFNNIREIVNSMAKSIINYAQAKIDIIIKTFVKWFVYLANEPSLGLFYIQMHLKESLIDVVDNKKYLQKTIKKLENTKISLSNTTKELDEICDLNTRWASSMSSLLDNL